MKPNVYDKGKTILDVKCRCGKVLTTFTAWDQHLREKHPKMRREMKKNGDLDQDRLEFRSSRLRGYPLARFR